MKYDIYFHNDFDGRASTAVMLAFLRSRGDDIEHFVPVNFDIKDQWLKKWFFKKHKLFRGRRNPAIVVDFLYHPEATWWFDHHGTSFGRADWSKKFRPSKFHHWNPKYQSCCRQVLDTLKKTFGWKPPRRLEELAKWLDVVDGANYKSAKQTIELKEPALQIAEIIDELAGKKRGSLVWLIELLSKKPLHKIAAVPKIRRQIKKLLKNIRESVNFYRKNLKRYGRVVFMGSLPRGIMLLRFAPYYIYPDALYFLRAKEVGEKKKCGLGLGVNPWRRKENKTDIGKFLSDNFGGGGHKTVGGAEFKNKKELDKAVQKIIKKFG